MSTSKAAAQLPAAARPRRWRSLLTLVGGVLALVVLLDTAIKALALLSDWLFASKPCEALAVVTREAVAELGLHAGVETVTDYAQMAQLGVLSTQALTVGGQLVTSGSVRDVERVKRLLVPEV